MINLNFPFNSESDIRILCLGAHSDDIEIGCGGTVLRLIDEFPQVSISWVVFGANGQRLIEAQQSGNKFVSKAKNNQIILKSFRDGYFPYIGAEIKDFFEVLKGQIAPDLIFTHYRNDLHQDHRLISELTWNTFRDHLILEYEIPKYDGDLGSPNFFISLEELYVLRKINLLTEIFLTQKDKYWFTEDTFISVLRIRGVEAKSPSGYAEAFYAHKLAI